MDREAIKKDMLSAFEEISKKHNVRLSYNLAYSNGDINIDLKVISKSKYKQMEVEELKQSELLGYPQSIIGLYFTYENLKYKIIKINLKKKAYPIVCLGPSGKRVAFDNKILRTLIKDEYINRENNLKTLLEDDD